MDRYWTIAKQYGRNHKQSHTVSHFVLMILSTLVT